MTRIAFASSFALSAALVTSSLPPAAAATEQVLYSFKGACCGVPYGRLHFMNGHLFGTGFGDGKSGDYGQVFELTNSGGTWTENSPLVFNSTDGADPAVGLISDTGGFLFGTTFSGDAYGSGNVFILDKLGGSWHHATIWPFGAIPNDGGEPAGDLVLDSAGNLYGTTYTGGAYGEGTVFELIPSFSSWSETILHSFGSGSDGTLPYAGLLLDSSGALYGTTRYGGNGSGTVFKLTQSGGVWKEQLLYSFRHDGSDGAYPAGVLIKDSKGALYGTTENGGHDSGNVFKVYESDGVWKEKVLYTFTGGSDGAVPYGGLRWGGAGVLYGTAEGGGISGNGTVFELTVSGGVWSESVLHTFTGGSDGNNPYDQVILDKSGNLYGTTANGGKYGYGTVWEVTP